MVLDLVSLCQFFFFNAFEIRLSVMLLLCSNTDHYCRNCTKRMIDRSCLYKWFSLGTLIMYIGYSVILQYDITIL